MHIVFTDIDGTLLDHNTYSYDESLAGIVLLRKKGIPLVLASSKTLTEMSELHRELELDTPIIFENGSGIACPSKDGYDITLGEFTAGELKSRLKFIEDFFDHSIELITEMEIEKISALSGLSIEKSSLARERIASLPFVTGSRKTIGAAELSRLNRAIEPHNIKVTRGGRFYHLLARDAGKDNAVKKIIRYYMDLIGGDIISVGLGDSENDVPMLRIVDIPYLVKRHDGSYLIGTGVDKIRKTKNIGPAGFSEAMKELFL